MKRSIGLALSFALLTGCATVSETMDEKPPSLQVESLKSPTAFRDCIVGSGIVAAYSVTERDGGFMFVDMKAPGQIILAKPHGEGSEIIVWGLLGTRRAARACV